MAVGVSVAAAAGQIGQISLGTSGKPFVAERVRSWGGIRAGAQIGSLVASYADPTKDLPSLAKRCSNVGVVTTINPCTESIRKVGKLADWCLIVVGDTKTEAETYVALQAEVEPGKVTYLSYDKQLQLPYKLVNATPARHFGRKNLGFLYAIHLGATAIFDFDDDNEVLGEMAIPKAALSDAGQKGEVAAHPRTATGSYSLLNPYALWPNASSGMWPRGFPLPSINNKPDVLKRNLSEVTRNLRIGVVQSLANIDPDVDAIYRLGPRMALPLPLRFPDRPEGQLVLGKHVYAPWNAQATLFSRDSMWAMFLPTTVHGRVSDIWRSYIAQRLMWDVGQHVMFHDAFVSQTRNVHDYMGDFMSERPLYETSGEIVRVLNEELGGTSSVPEAIETAYITMYEFGFIEDKDISSIQLWLQDLAGVGYQWPQMVETPPSRHGAI